MALGQTVKDFGRYLLNKLKKPATIITLLAILASVGIGKNMTPEQQQKVAEAVAAIAVAASEIFQEDPVPAPKVTVPVEPVPLGMTGPDDGLNQLADNAVDAYVAEAQAEYFPPQE